MDQMDLAETWLKSRLQRAGLDIVVKKLSGCNSSEHKEKVMSDFRSG